MCPHRSGEYPKVLRASQPSPASCARVASQRIGTLANLGEEPHKALCASFAGHREMQCPRVLPELRFWPKISRGECHFWKSLWAFFRPVLVPAATPVSHRPPPHSPRLRPRLRGTTCPSTSGSGRARTPGPASSSSVGSDLGEQNVDSVRWLGVPRGRHPAVGPLGPHPVIGAGHPFLSLLWRSQAGLLRRDRSGGFRSSQGSAFSHEEPPPLVAATAVKLRGLMIPVRRSPIFSYQPVRLGARYLAVRPQSVSVVFHKVTSVAIPLPLPWVFLGDSGQFRGIAWKGLKNRKSPKPLRFRALLLGGPIGIRTRVSALRGPRPRPG